MALLDLFIASSIPVLKVLLVTAIGSILALDHINILGEYTRKHMNNSVVSAKWRRKLLLSSSSSGDWSSTMDQLLGLSIFTTTGVPLWVSFDHQSNDGNLLNMLLIIIPAACKEKGSPFGDPDACHQYGMAYASLSMAVPTIDKVKQQFGMLLKKVNLKRLFAPSTTGAYQGQYDPMFLNINPISISWRDPPQGRSLPMAQAPTLQLDERNSFSLNFVKGIHLDPVIPCLNCFLSLLQLVGFIVGLVPQIRMSMIGDRAPLRVIQDSISLLGDGAIPSLTLIMGGDLLKGSGVQKSIITGIIVVHCSLIFLYRVYEDQEFKSPSLLASLLFVTLPCL
ncbi:hypothetical protein TEA_017114 [Camellia sinensis var. sinensis]|uniref:Uncharacterized protein n=1 Tax=Camellia sinensis var. sinensis TaxID=542762 RepID=A0A4S4D9W4_CAMSN|nr:hypothetical protein TEA_017114 [Camellia sinensis var. sinensis]